MPGALIVTVAGVSVNSLSVIENVCDDDAPFVIDGGRLSGDAMKEIVEIGREALRIKEAVPPEKIFDFSLAADAMK